MNYVVAVFRSRNESMKFMQQLQRYNIPCAIINTPKEANASCGVSVKFNEKYFGVANKLVRSDMFSSFLCFLRTNETTRSYIRL